MQPSSFITGGRNSLIISGNRVGMIPGYASKLSMWASRSSHKPNGKTKQSSLTNVDIRLPKQKQGEVGEAPVSNAQPHCSRIITIEGCAAEQEESAGDSNPSLVVVSFYKFADFPDHAHMRSPLRELCEELRVSGGIILAPEGINGSICGTPSSVEKILLFIEADDRLKGLRLTESPVSAEDEVIHHGHTSKSPLGAGEDAPFRWDHVRVKLKKEVVSLGVPGISPAKKVGKYVNPKEWNTLISDPDTMVVDVRNSYEIRIGKFKGAVDPHTSAFREFPSWIEKRLFMDQSNGGISQSENSLIIPDNSMNDLDEQGKQQLVSGKIPLRLAMYCTGGIRCEKATSFLLSKGFEEVYHLEGGILKYLEEVPPSESLWEGECFVFDKRVSVEHGLKQGTYKLCYACKEPVSDVDMQSAEWEYGVSCPRCCYSKSEEEKARARARQRQFDIWGVVGGPDKGMRCSQRDREQIRGQFPISRSL